MGLWSRVPLESLVMQVLHIALAALMENIVRLLAAPKRLLVPTVKQDTRASTERVKNAAVENTAWQVK